MLNDKELSKNFIQYVLNEQHLSLQKLADKLGCTKSYLGLISSGKTALSEKYFNKIIETYPEYANIDITKIKVFKNHIGRSNTIKITVFNSNYLNDTFKDRRSSGFYYYEIDKRIIENHYTVTDTSQFEVAIIANNLLEPMYVHNDRVLLETSIKSLIGGYIFVFYMNDDLYIREVIKNGNSIMMANPNNRNDYFIIDSESEIDIVGLVIPKIKF